MSKLDSLLVPLQDFLYLRIGQLSERSAWGFHVRLLIDQAHCLRDPKGTAPASGHGSIDGPKGRERVRALVRYRSWALCQTPRRRQWLLFFLPVLGVLMGDWRADARQARGIGPARFPLEGAEGDDALRNVGAGLVA